MKMRPRPPFGLRENAWQPTVPLRGSTHLDPERCQFEKANYEHHLVEAIAAALAIRDEFYKGLAIRQIINVCRRANDLDIAKTLFKEVDHHSLREQIVKDAPELAGEKKVLADDSPQDCHHSPRRALIMKRSSTW